MNNEKFSGNIAIVGMSCRFPKSKNIHQYWNNLINGVDCVTEIPNSKWDADAFFSEDITNQHKTNCKWIGALDDIDMFDHNFFGISPKEAINMDPHQRILLQECWKCIEDSAISLKTLQNKQTSVHIGSVSFDKYHTDTIDATTGSGKYYFMLANRVSYFLGLTGESFTMDTGCSSSFVALNSACQSLLLNASDYALVGGINLHMSPQKYVTWAKSRMLSPTGKCHAFSNDADGYVAGEGVGIVLIQPLEKAIESNNMIYAVIKSCAVNHGGRSLSLTAPNVEAQKEVIDAAYRRANFTPDTVSYVEAHGTGTSLGDPIELEALNRVFKPYSSNLKYCKIGSVKSNIGHLEGCSSMASLIKVILMIRHKQIPKSLHLKNVNLILNMKDSPFCFAQETSDWERLKKDAPLRAGISSFGIGGTNAHVLLEEYTPVKSKLPDIAKNNKQYFLLSAKSAQSLKMMKQKWKECIIKGQLEPYTLEQISSVLLAGREHFTYRFGVLVNNVQELLIKLNDVSSDSKKSIIPSYCTIIKNCNYSGFANIPHCLRQMPAFRQILVQVKQQLCDAGVEDIIFNEFLLESWKMEHRELNIFLLNYVVYSTFNVLGVKSDVITGCQNGTYVALVIANMVSFSDIVQHLLNNKPFEKILIKRPDIAFYDWKSGEMIYPYQIQRNVIESLVGNIILSGEICNQYIEKAKILYHNQYTFKKFVNEWTPHITSWGDAENMLNIVHIPNRSLFHANPAQLILMVMIISSLERVNKKWNLHDERLLESNELYEVLNLINNNIISKNDFVNLVLCRFTQSDFDALLVRMNYNINHTNQKHQYSLLKSAELTATITDWTNESCKEVSIHDTEFIIFGKEKSMVNSFYLDLTAEMPDENLKNFLLNVWLNGCSIDWTQLVDSDHYKKLELPTYCFNTQSFWQNQINVMKSNQAVMEKNKEELDINDNFKTDVSLCPVWKKAKLKVHSQITSLQNIVVFCNTRKEEIQKILCEKYSDAQITLISLDTVCNQCDNVQRTLNSLKTINRVYFFTDEPQKSDVKFIPEQWEAAQEFGVICLLKIVKILCACGYTVQPIDLIAVTSGCFTVGRDKNSSPMYAAVYGLAKSIAKEFHAWKVVSCDLDSIGYGDAQCLERFEENIIQVLFSDFDLPTGRELAVRDGILYEKVLEHIKLESKETAFIKNGTYMIVGGNGGIGFELAKYLAKKYHASIVILARSTYTQTQKRKIDELNKLGANAIYIQTDICEINSMINAVSKVKNTFGKINGVIHSALVLNDSLLINSKETEFREVIAPKIIGSINMYESLKSEPLDFMMYFSSIESFLSLEGQGNYIAGCSFQDYFAEYINQCTPFQVCTINWGFWGEVGIAANQFYHEKFKKIGLLPISNKTGIQWIEAVLGSSYRQLLCLKAEPKLVEQLPMVCVQSNDYNEEKSSFLHSEKIITPAYVEEVICTALEELLEIDGDSINSQTLFYDIGVDSITEFDILIFINQKLNIDLKPTDMINYESMERLVQYICTEFFQSSQNQLSSV